MLAFLWLIKVALWDLCGPKPQLDLLKHGQSTILNMVWTSPTQMVKTDFIDLQVIIHLEAISPIRDYPVSQLLDISIDFFVLTLAHMPGDGQDHHGVHLGHVGGRGAGSL